MLKRHGFASDPPEHVVPVTFQPEKVQLGSGIAVTLILCPTTSEQPDGHDGLVVPWPTLSVVKFEQFCPTQLIVTVSGGACLTSPWETPVTVTTYCVPGVAF